MNDIKQIQLTVSGLLNGTSVEVLNVEAVPEPDTALLTIAGLVVLAAHRRRSR
jgi:hypothetical protein